MSTSVPGNSCRTSRGCFPPNSQCLIKLSGECVYYSGTTILGPAIYPKDNLNIVVNKLVQYIQSGTGTVSASNGLSINNQSVVFGQDISEIGDPAALTSTREIPMSGYHILLRGSAGDTIFLSNQGMIAIESSATGVSSTSTLDLELTWDTSGNPSVIYSNITDIASDNSSYFLNLNRNSIPVFSINKDSTTTFTDKFSIPYIKINPLNTPFEITTIANGAFIDMEIDLEPSDTVSRNISGIGMTTTISPLGGTLNFSNIDINNSIDGGEGGITNVRGIYYHPTQVVGLPSIHRAWENSLGDIIFNTTDGYVGVHGITSPNAYIHIAAGTAGNAPLKFSPGGVLLTLNQQQVIETTDSHIYWTDSFLIRHQLDQQLTGSVDWSDITNKPSTNTIQFVTSGSQSTYVDNALINVPNSRIIVSRNGILQFNSNPGDGDSYFIKNTSDNFLTFLPTLTASEKIIIIILAI
jgi:hypothetical protein